jgi:hypothetical protein
MIDTNTYPVLTEFMRKSLFQCAAPTFEEAVRLWKRNGEKSVRALIREIDRLLSAGHAPQELDEFLERYSEYAEEEGGRATFAHIRAVLEGA